jgi:hypothetical protein
LILFGRIDGVYHWQRREFSARDANLCGSVTVRRRNTFGDAVTWGKGL